MTIPFTKMHGCGNDYIYVNAMQHPIAHPQACAVAWSDRHKGIGSDGLVLIGRPTISEADIPTASQLMPAHPQASLQDFRPIADFTMHIFNADGSEAMMCGNASRCIGKYLYEKGLTTQTQIRLLTQSGVKTLLLHLAEDCISTGNDPVGKAVESVTVDMGEPVFINEKQYNPSFGTKITTSSPTGREDRESSLFVSMGNPHYVIFVDDVDTIDIAGEGAKLEHHPAFPERANIEFAEMRPDGIRVRVWERGSGITQACGTGACATAVAACKTGRTGRKNRIIMDGGELEIEWNEADNHVYMTGPAEFVFEGEIEDIEN